MGKDIGIVDDNNEFKLRVCGIIIKDSRILLQKINSNNFYSLPGGHVELGEDTKEAVIREIKEEVEIDVDVKKLIAINENFYNKKGKLFQEIGYYYIVSPVDNKKLNNSNYTRIEIDKGIEKTLTFEWINIDDIQNIDFRPEFLKEKIRFKKFDTEYLITK